MLAKIHPRLTSIGVETLLLLAKQAQLMEFKPQIGLETHKPIYILQPQIGLETYTPIYAL